MALTPSTYWRGQVDQKLLDHDEQLDEHDTRLTSVERFMWKVLGMAMVGALVGGCIATAGAYLILAALHVKQ